MWRKIFRSALVSDIIILTRSGSEKVVQTFGKQWRRNAVWQGGGESIETVLTELEFACNLHTRRHQQLCVQTTDRFIRIHPLIKTQKEQILLKGHFYHLPYFIDENVLHLCSAFTVFTNQVWLLLKFISVYSQQKKTKKLLQSKFNLYRLRPFLKHGLAQRFFVVVFWQNFCSNLPASMRP